MNAWWQNLNPSEKRLMLLGGIAIGLTLLWRFVLKLVSLLQRFTMGCECRQRGTKQVAAKP